ncbi:MAG TPA: nucleotidyltransferase family protein, partial [Verrucomicrobiae bacterium]|nr:nucleotidyltransferase family protein [Verrucomicrobiae bacterium]
MTGFPQKPNDISLAAIILAAGQSSRMGRPKMLLPWGKTTILGHLIGLWTKLPANQIAIICAANDTAINDELDRLEFSRENRIVNPDPARGMFSSVQCAARWPGWHPSLTHWAIALGDQPHLQPGTLEALVGFAAQHPGRICQPARHDHPRHPVLLPETAFRKLADSNSETLKEFLQPLVVELSLVEVNDPGLELDIDVPADY